MVKPVPPLLWLAALNVEYRDVGNILPFMMQIGLLVTPIFYASIVIPEPWRVVYGLNPMVGVVEGMRWALLGTANGAAGWLMASMLVTTLLVVSGLAVFQRRAEHFADVVQRMTDAVIQTWGLGKRYRPPSTSPGLALHEALERRLRDPFRRAAAAFTGTPRHEPFGHAEATRREGWAVRDLSVTVRHGEVVGVVGANGAGKSASLKLLARVTRPTTGRAEIRGRVGAMLEVSAGFHPELTGRENVALHGALLGMTRAEIARKFDAIVAFADIDGALNTPVKWYSSGMLVRLAFAVAAHLEPEILLVDEVLAVGDDAFQRKSVAKLREIAAEGRTILMVRHQVYLVADVCTRALLLDQGQLILDSTPAAVLARHHARDG